MVRKRVLIKPIRKRSHEESEISPLLISAAAGALAGVVLAYCYAPHPKPREIGFTLTKARRGSSRNHLLWLGALAGGAVGLYALLSKEGKKGHNIVNTFRDAGQAAVNGFKSIDWGDVAENVVDSLQDEDEEEELKEGPSKIQNLVDWAILGLNVWQNIKKGR